MESPIEGGLERGEIWWRDNYDWFLGQGYRLRSRYHPDWVPSWLRNPRKKPPRLGYEDWNHSEYDSVNDAIQLSDGRHVVLKKVSKQKEPEELKIMQFLNQEELLTDPRNHCVPLLNHFQSPEDDYEIVVMPLLRDYDDPQFDTVGEVMDFIRQILEGFAFLHEHRIAHRDVKGENILMNAVGLGITDFHFSAKSLSADGKKRLSPKHYRTERWPKYYLIDFGFSSQYSPDEMPPMELPRFATDETLPELDNHRTPCNPFPVDVYYVGNLIRAEILDGLERNPIRSGYHGLEFLRPLVDAMIKKAPEERISMAEAVLQFEKIVSELPDTVLRNYPYRLSMSNRSPRDGWSIEKVFHWIRRIIYIILRFPPIPEAALDDEELEV
ncbi:other/AgaK1 protein kinase [Coprinopsis sp. MPI-PUGE-AT-0042]|nr:other/AgaK1 protein kinase [Coprinopsis sp. MPI-PUGE-AT-0042]